MSAVTNEVCRGLRLSENYPICRRSSFVPAERKSIVEELRASIFREGTWCTLRSIPQFPERRE
jgi:hypothetical protein